MDSASFEGIELDVLAGNEPVPAIFGVAVAAVALVQPVVEEAALAPRATESWRLPPKAIGLVGISDIAWDFS